MEEWSARKAKLKEKFSKLGEANTTRLEVQHEELVTRLQRRLGATREAILKLLSEL